MFHKGIEDMKGDNYQNVGSGTQILSLCFNHCSVLVFSFLSLVNSDLFEVRNLAIPCTYCIS